MLDLERPVLDPVVINGSTGWLGQALSRRLASVPIEIRLVSGGKELAAACRDSSSVVHLDDSLRSNEGRVATRAIADAAQQVVDDLAGSSVERIVYVSNVGASPSARNRHLRAKAAAEACLHRSGRDTVVFRCTHVFGPPDDPGEIVAALRADSRNRAVVIGSGRQRVAPVYREDVVEAIVAALDPRNYHGRFDLPGRDVMTVDQLVRAINRDDVAIRHVWTRAARMVGRTSHLPAELLGLMAMESLGEQTRADRAFGLERRGLRDVYRMSRTL